MSRAAGVVFCESTDTAKFSGMPLSAIRSGVVDQVMAPEEIAMAIAALSGPVMGAGLDTGEPSPEERGVDAILRLLRDEYGIDFSDYKVSTVSRPIERRLALNRSLDLDTYVSQLRSDPRELNSLYEDLLIGVTRFFRDDDAFAVLRERVVPDIVEHTAPEDQIRVWVPGCATGQEAYSIAMLFHDAEYWSHPICQGGNVIGAVVAFVDISERKQAEREVQDGVRRREQFLAMLWHELRNPLAATLSATRLLRLEPLPSEPSMKAADVVERQAKHVARLLDDLLDVSRITGGPGRLAAHDEASARIARHHRSHGGGRRGRPGTHRDDQARPRARGPRVAVAGRL